GAATGQLVQKKAQSDKKLTQNEEKLAQKKNQSWVAYTGPLSGVSLEYTTHAEMLKENIVLKTKTTPNSFSFIYDFGILKPVLNPDNSLSLVEPSAGETIFTIDAPYMFDAKFEMSTDITVNIEKQQNRTAPQNLLKNSKAKELTERAKETISDADTYKITWTASEEWLGAKERAYPVTIDPTIMTDQYFRSVDETYAASYDPNGNRENYEHIRAGYYTAPSKTPGFTRSLIRVNNLPQLESGDKIVDAKLYLKVLNTLGYADPFECKSDYQYSPQLNIHKMTSSWNLNTVTWNTLWQSDWNAGFDPKVVDYQVMDPADDTDPIYYKYSSRTSSYRYCMPSKKDYLFDMTSIAMGWYNGEANNGVLLKYANEQASSDGWAREMFFWATNAIYGDLNDFPAFVLTYRNTIGLEDYWTYHSQSAGRAGSGHVNDYTGNLVFVHNDAATPGGLMPAGLSHVYNAHNSAVDGFGAGNGWQLSVNERLLWMSSYLDGNTTLTYQQKEWMINYYPIIYWDPDGTVHYFRAKSGAQNTYVDEDGLDLEFIANPGAPFEQTFDLNYESGAKKIFDASGWLRRVYDSNGNFYEQSYSGGKCSQLTAPGGIISLVWSNGRLASVVDNAGRYTNYYYDGAGNLSQIVDPDSEAVSYQYDGNFLTKAIGIDENFVAYTYAPQAPRRVISFSDSTGAAVTAAYSHNETVFTDNFGRSVTYQFNNWGQTVSVKDDEGNAQYFKQFKNETGEYNINANKVTSVSNLQRSIASLIFNGGAESDLGNWYHSTWDSGAQGGVSLDTTEKYMGASSLKVTKTDSANTASLGYQYFDTRGASKLNLSAYIKTDLASGGRVSIGLFTDAGFSKVSAPITGTFDWARVSLTADLPAGTASAYVGLVIQGTATGTAWFDCIQVEANSAPSRFNLLTNADLERGGAV
ncbi:MAG TPA: DNRLRE domain-containing protein, partial [Candidatus Wallbacteria bacterium]|nr:DNRLRE domain-containing protein [Candidatus Wallbacteria bacterium]